MEDIENNIDIEEEQLYRAFIPVKFINGTRSYFFGVYKNEEELNEGDFVVVETSRGMELGETTSKETSIEHYRSDLGLKPVLRKANQADIRMAEANAKDAAYAMTICQAEVTKLGLDMHLISSEYTLDKTKITFSYLADDRVDFRELLKVLAYKLHVRIELRQIGSRDKSKMIGGLGVCGLPLCCSTFLNEFDGISISRAKNQMLAINIPKLSGQCGKLMCCLKFEDDFYTDVKKDYPDVGSKVWIDKKEYAVMSINVISTAITLKGTNEDGEFMVVDLEQFNKLVYKPKEDENNNRDRKPKHHFFGKNKNEKK